jgi:hypothetical protein
MPIVSQWKKCMKQDWTAASLTKISTARHCLPIMFSILDHVKAREVSDPVEKFTDWERFQSLASDLVSPKIQINSSTDADKAARDFTAPIACVIFISFPHC